MMTLEEAIAHAKEISENQYICEECQKEHRQLADWLEELKSLREKSKWIPVSERLPDKYMKCFVTVNKKYPPHGFTDVFVMEDTYFECEGEFNWQSKFEGMDWNIVAWMPLPEPYKGE